MDAHSSLALEKLLTTKQLLECIDKQRAAAQEGRVVELGELAVELGYLKPDQIQSEVGRLHGDDVSPEEIIDLALAGETDVPTPAPTKEESPAAQSLSDSFSQFSESISESKPAVSKPPAQVHEPVPMGAEVPSMVFAIRLKEMAGKSLIGGTLMGYQIKALIGQGPISDVYRVERPGSNVPLRLKVFAKSLFKSRTSIQRFLSRARLAARLDHPNFIQPLDFGETEQNLCYYISRYEEGIPLWLLIRRMKRLKERMALATIRFLAKALLDAHGQGIIHGNLKPSNILISSPKGTVLILDCGAPRVCFDLSSGRLNKEGHRMETVSEGTCYSAPEVVSGESAEIGRESDVYSLGAILYNMLTNQVPFSGSHEEVADVMFRQSFPVIPDSDTAVSDGTRDILKAITNGKHKERIKLPDALRMIEDHLRAMGK
ncbi:MAG TPA: serine/threonine-protein kinase [Candidatus Brocadiia bacterium]|nr:serine/threonine-protein kinase [Candidatus Brocadiia bacterium]